jgi:fluoride exporter
MTTPELQQRRPLPTFSQLAAVAAGGAVGAPLRYAFVLLFPPDPGRFPVVTAAENLVGALLLAFVLTAMLGRWRSLEPYRLFLGTGLLGSFTTFSTLSLELVQLLQAGAFGTAALYALSSLLGGVLAAVAGVVSARKLLGERA